MESSAAPGEFELISRYFSDIGPADPALGQIGDDCAGLTVPAGKTLQISVDTLCSETHFLPDAPADLIARRALAVCISDLAAMGATPWCFTLALTLPESDHEWVSKFSAGLSFAADQFGIRLVGGDTTRGPLSVTLQVMGLTDEGVALQRSAAKIGDSIWVTGSLGLARAALETAHLADPAAAPASDAVFLDAYYAPQVPSRFATEVAGLVLAGIDISDGLLADVSHILSASGCGAKLDCAVLPRSSEMIARFGEASALDWALSGGDDYQLCFTASAGSDSDLLALAQRHGVRLTRIGDIVEGEGVSLINLPNGFEMPETSGYQHFRSKGDE